MKKMQSPSAAVLLAAFLVLISCDCPEAEKIFTLKKGSASFSLDLSQLENPRGVLPAAICGGEKKVTANDSENYHEYFAYDRRRALIVLSADPLYYADIRSGDYYHALEFEHSQLAAQKSPSEKKPASIPFFRTYGNISVCLYFIPNEMRYSDGGALADVNSSTSSDPFRLYGAASELLFYTPCFLEERLYSDMLNLSKGGKRVIQFTRSAAFDTQFENQRITWYERPEIAPLFSLIAGRALDAAADAHSGDFQEDVPGDEDFLFLTSVPLGNSQKKEESFLADTASGRHGIALMVRGDITEYLRFLEGEGIGFDEKAELPLSLVIEDSYTNYVTADWAIEQDVQLFVSYVRGDFSKAGAINARGSCCRIYYPERGKTLYIRVLSAASGEILAESSLYLTDLVISEIAYHGSSFYAQEGDINADDFIEIKNISGQPVDLSSIDITLINTNLAERFWCGPSHESYEGCASLSYDSLDTTLAAGERIIVCTPVNGNSGRLFHKSNFGIPPNCLERGAISKISIGKGYSIRLSRGGDLIHAVKIDGLSGTKAPYRSMVRDSGGEWKTSENQIISSPQGGGGPKDFCSPGFAAEGEL